MALADTFRSTAVSLASRARAYVVPLLLSSVLGFFAVRAILERAGRPALPLDDSFIHLQYARRFAEGHPFTFTQGGGYSSGATSFLWPLMLAPFSAAGMHGLTLVWAAWFLGTVFHAALVLETVRLTEPLAGRGAAIATGAAVLFFGAFTWFAWSGMETIAFTWSLVRTARLAAEWLEMPAHDRSKRVALGLAVMGAISPLLRPEGVVVTLVAAGALLYAGPALDSLSSQPLLRGATSRLFAVVPFLGAAVSPLINLALTGHARSNTATVKWYVGNPYFEGERLVAAFVANVKMLLTDLLAGGPYTAIFLPEGSHFVIAAGFGALSVAIVRKKTRARALIVLALVLGTLIPCTFSTILWNRVRYIWPFAPGWFVLVACLGKELAVLGARMVRGAEHLGAIIPAIFAGALGSKLPWTIADLATSARAIDLQQVTLGMWAQANLPKDARIGVNDTGAIAYFSNRRTFDVVGLTTEGEARYWVQGTGSRYEHYERMHPEDLPTHFIVYPQWMGIGSILGPELTHATVTDQSILGGATKVAYEARYDVLGRAALPRIGPKSAPLVAEVDVADLDSEVEHGFGLGDTWDSDDQVFTEWDDDSHELVDGGRANRYSDRFRVALDDKRAARMVARLGADRPTTLTVFADDVEIGKLEVPEGKWNELELPFPAEHASQRTRIRVEPVDPAMRFSSLHYWFFAVD